MAELPVLKSVWLAWNEERVGNKPTIFNVNIKYWQWALTPTPSLFSVSILFDRLDVPNPIPPVQWNPLFMFWWI